MDGDHDADLLVSREPGKHRPLRNRDGAFVDISEAVGLSSHVGLWQGLAVGDFNNDGRVDLSQAILAATVRSEPYRDGLVSLSRGEDPRLTLFALKEGGKLLPIDDMDLYSRVIDRATLPETYREFSDVDLSSVMKSFSPMKQTKITCLDASVFFNRGGRFERVALPGAAQLSPVSAINVADFDNDGRDDLFLSQNWYSTRPDVGRLDSGAGLILLGQAEGQFQPVDSGRSGLRILGENLNAAVADFDRDGTSRYHRAADAWPSAVLLWPGGEARHPAWDFPGRAWPSVWAARYDLTYADGSDSPRRWLAHGGWCAGPRDG